MHKLVILVETPQDEDAFNDEWPLFLFLAERMPGLRRESTSHIDTMLSGSLSYSLIHELYFDSLEELKAAMKSQEGRLAGTQIQKMTRGRVGLLVADHQEDSLAHIQQFNASPVSTSPAPLSAEVKAGAPTGAAPQDDSPGADSTGAAQDDDSPGTDSISAAQNDDSLGTDSTGAAQNNNSPGTEEISAAQNDNSPGTEEISAAQNNNSPGTEEISALSSTAGAAAETDTTLTSLTEELPPEPAPPGELPALEEPDDGAAQSG